MADVEKELSLAEQAEALEERFALKELSVLQKLKNAAASNSISGLRDAVRELGILENDLFSAHQNVLSHITTLSQALLEQAKALKTLEVQIQEKIDAIFKILSVRGGTVFALAKS